MRKILLLDAIINYYTASLEIKIENNNNNNNFFLILSSNSFIFDFTKKSYDSLFSILSVLEYDFRKDYPSSVGSEIIDIKQSILNLESFLKEKIKSHNLEKIVLTILVTSKRVNSSLFQFNLEGIAGENVVISKINYSKNNLECLIEKIVEEDKPQ